MNGGNVYWEMSGYHVRTLSKYFAHKGSDPSLYGRVHLLNCFRRAVSECWTASHEARGSNPSQGRNFCSTFTNSVMMSTLTTHCQWEDEMVRERTGHSLAYAVGKKMTLQTLRTQRA